MTPAWSSSDSFSPMSLPATATERSATERLQLGDGGPLLALDGLACLATSARRPRPAPWRRPRPHRLGGLLGLLHDRAGLLAGLGHLLLVLLEQPLGLDLRGCSAFSSDSRMLSARWSSMSVIGGNANFAQRRRRGSRNEISAGMSSASFGMSRFHGCYLRFGLEGTRSRPDLGPEQDGRERSRAARGPRRTRRRE